MLSALVTEHDNGPEHNHVAYHQASSALQQLDHNPPPVGVPCGSAISEQHSHSPRYRGVALATCVGVPDNGSHDQQYALRCAAGFPTNCMWISTSNPLTRAS